MDKPDPRQSNGTFMVQSSKKTFDRNRRTIKRDSQSGATKLSLKGIEKTAKHFQ